MAKRRVWDLRSMSDDQLRAAIREAESRERELGAPHRKGRRGWRRLAEDARAELRTRGGSA